MPDQNIILNNVFHALADPTRRAVIHQLAMGEATVSELSAPFGMALQSFVQHLQVLEDSGLLSSKKVGRVRVCKINPRQLQLAEEWTGKLRVIWDRRLDNLDKYLSEGTSKNTRKA